MKICTYLLLIFQLSGILNVSAQSNRGQFNRLDEAIKYPEEVVVLDLSLQNIKQWPQGLPEFPNLEILLLRGTGLVTVPTSFGKSKKLIRIDISANPAIEIEQVAEVFSACSELRFISASASNLLMLPFELCALPKLEELDLSNNLISFFPEHAKQLKNLVRLDISGNPLSGIEPFMRTWPKLSYLDVSELPDINQNELFDGLAVHASLQSLRIDSLEKLPASFSRLKLQSILIRKSKLSGKDLEMISHSSIRLIRMEQVKISGEEVWKDLSNVSNLNSLSFFQCDLSEIPESIWKKEGLKNFSAEYCNLKSIPAENVSTTLEIVDLRGNDISAFDISKFKAAQPNVTCFSDYDRPDLALTSIGAVSKNLETPFQVSTIDPSVPNVIQGEKILVQFPANAFVDGKGKVVKGEVEVRFREFTDAVDIALNGIPMNMESDSETVGMYSAGMFEIRVRKGGEELNVNPDAPYSVTTTMDVAGDDYRFFSINDSSGKWEAEPNVVEVKEPLTFETATKEQLDSLMSLFGLRPAPYRYTRISISLVKPRRNKDPFIRIINMNDGVDDNLSITSFLEQYELVYDGQDRQSDFKKLDSLGKIFRTTTFYSGWIFRKKFLKPSITNPAIITDVKLLLNKPRDNFFLVFYASGDSCAFEVYPKLNYSGVDDYQKKLLAFWDTYKKRRKEYEKEKALATQAYEKRLKQFYSRLLNFRINTQGQFVDRNIYVQKRDRRGLLNPIYGTARVVLGISTLGMKNVDKIYPPPPRREAIAGYRTKDGENIEPSLVQIVNRDFNGVINEFTNGKNYGSVSSGGENALILRLKNGNIGLANSKDMKSAFKSDGVVTVKIVDPKKTTATEIRSYLF